MKSVAKILLPLFFLVALDLGTKEWISATMTKGGPSIPIIPGFFQLTLVHNTGAAFGVGNRWSTTFFVLTSLAALGVIIYLFVRLKPSERFSKRGLILIMSGAIGNLVDRIRFGYVVDFLDAYVGKLHWPAFNVADAAITVGAVLYAIDLLWPSKERGERT